MGNYTRGLVLKGNVEIGHQLCMIELIFFKMKLAAASIPSERLNNVKSQWKKMIVPCFVIGTCFENSEYNDTFGFLIYFLKIWKNYYKYNSENNFWWNFDKIWRALNSYFDQN
jgi:hypothetical protein